MRAARAIGKARWSWQDFDRRAPPHNLRPGPNGALAAVELLIARRAAPGFDLEETRKWAALLGRTARLDRVIAQADVMSSI
ncbi:MAG: hypothetical protein AMXMBFR56_78000 [Polyangiaceae bacterium]